MIPQGGGGMILEEEMIAAWGVAADLMGWRPIYAKTPGPWRYISLMVSGSEIR